MDPSDEVAPLSRWELFRLLGEPVRLRLLALAEAEELSIGELSELLGEAQPNISRHVKPLRQAGLLAVRKEGTRVLVRLASAAPSDAVIKEALDEGRTIAREDGSLDRIAGLVRERERAARAYFDARTSTDPTERPAELGAYVALVGALLPRRRLAVDAGTGDGRMLEVLAPAFERVVAIDRSEAQLSRARARCEARGFRNVELVNSELEDPALERRVRNGRGADAVFASRVLHHAASPAAAMRALASLLAKEGSLVLLDYAAHEDESMRAGVADVWLGFTPRELTRLARDAGLEAAEVRSLEGSLRGTGPDAHLEWQLLVAQKGAAATSRRPDERAGQERTR